MTQTTDVATGELWIDSENDIVAARRAVRLSATGLNFGTTDVTRIVTAASELARNVYVHARAGMMRWRTVRHGQRVGLELVFEDHGPGIADIGRAMQDGFSTNAGLGMGLPGSRRLMDDFSIQSKVGIGTTVSVTKWRR